MVKYFWGQTVWIVDKLHKMDVFEARLASVSIEGLNVPNVGAAYMCQYSGSLIGKHFKTIAQIMEFVVYDLVPKTVLQAWRAIGALVVLLWHTQIDDTEAYIVGQTTSTERTEPLTCCPAEVKSSNSRFPHPDGTMRPQYSYQQAKISLPRPLAPLH